jgi:hypothetical protein
MRHFSATLRALATWASLAALAGCAATTAAPVTAVNADAVVTAADIDRLTGAPWSGTLTYLDYTSRAQTTIRSSLLVTRLPAPSVGSFAWDMRVGYADEPNANDGETALLMSGGRVFRGGQVMERMDLPDGTVRIVTEKDGEDDRQVARLRFVYLLGEKQVSIQKLVRFTPQEAFFERHIYQWSR